MTIDSNFLEHIEELAGLFYSPAQIAVMMECDADWLAEQLMDRDGDVHKHYARGHYTADAEFRKGVKKLANMGSSPAQTLLNELIKQSKMNTV